MNTFLEGAKKIGNRYRLQEKIIVKPEKIATTEKILIEGKSYEPKTKYRFKVWNSDFNANGRNYANILNKVVKENRTTIGLMNHPEDEPDTRNIFGVEKNPRIDSDGWLSVEFYPCGEYGKLISDIIDNDGPLEISSSALGDIDNNGYVLEEGFELERYFDIVTDCSNRLVQFPNYTLKHEEGNLEKVSDEGISNREITESVVKQHGDNATDSNNRGENIMPENEKLLKETMKMNIKSLIKDSDKTENLHEKKEILQSAHSYAQNLEEKDLNEEIEKKLEEVNNEIKVLSEKGLQTDSLNESIKKLTEDKKILMKEVTTLNEEIAVLEKKYKVVASMYEEKQYKAGEDEVKKNRRLAKEVCALKLKLRRQSNTLEEEKQKSKIMKIKMDRMEAIANTKVEAEVVNNLKEKIKYLEHQNSSLHSCLRNMREKKLNEKPVSKFDKTLRNIKEKRIKENSQINSSEKKDLNEDEKMEKMLKGEF